MITVAMKVKKLSIIKAVPQVFDLHLRVDYSDHVAKAAPARRARDNWRHTGQTLGRAMEKIDTELREQQKEAPA